MDALREAAEAGMRAMAEKLQPVTEAGIAVVTSLSAERMPAEELIGQLRALDEATSSVAVNPLVLANLVEQVAAFAPGPGPGWWQTQ